MNNLFNNTFTVEKGIIVQTIHLDKWKCKLKPEYFEKVHERAIRDNHKAKSGYDIFRGSDIDTFVHNL